VSGGKALVDEGELGRAGRTQAVRPTGLSSWTMVRHHAHAEQQISDPCMSRRSGSRRKCFSTTPKLNMVAFNSSCTTIQRQNLIYLISHTHLQYKLQQLEIHVKVPGYVDVDSVPGAQQTIYWLRISTRTDIRDLQAANRVNNYQSW